MNILIKTRYKQRTIITNKFIIYIKISYYVNEKITNTYFAFELNKKKTNNY